MPHPGLRRSDLIQPCFEFGWWDHRRILFIPLEKVSVTADNEVGVVGASEVDHVVIVRVTGQRRSRGRIGHDIRGRGQCRNV